MFRRGLIIPVLLAVVPVAAAGWVFSPTIFRALSDAPIEAQAPPPQSAAVNVPDLEALAPREGTPERQLGFDVARISPDGWSVFAGTAPPNAMVTVTADGKPIGTAKADAHGEWTLLSDHRFAKLDPDLGVSARSGGEPTSDEHRPANRLLDEGNDGGPATAELSPPARMLRNFEDLVAAARLPEPRPEPRATVRGPVPVPIQFVFRRAEFTDEGRNAAELLSEYLKLKNPESIVLTGHADERGDEIFNIELSRQRLETVAKYLRQNGYQGRLVLIPKGSSEPYQGVDRTSLDRRTLWQLDRRVELELDTDAQPRRSVQGSRRSIPR